MAKSDPRDKAPNGDYFMIRVTPEQKARIERAAKRSGFRFVSEYLRQVALKAAKKNLAT